MSLEDLNRELHSRDTHLDRARLVVHDEHTQEEIETEKQAFQKKEDWQIEPKQEIYLVSPDVKKARKKKIYWAAGIISTLLILGGASFFGYTYLKRQSAVSIAISGPASVASAEQVSFGFAYENKSFNEVSNATLLLTLPEGFRADPNDKMIVTGRNAEIKIGTIIRGATGKVSVAGKFYGAKGDKKNIDAVLRFSPKGSSSQFESKDSFEVILASSPLLFEVTAPGEVGSGQQVEYELLYENKSPEVFRNTRVVVEYPEGFQFASADPAPGEGENVWFLSELKPNQSGKIIIRGNLSGTRDSVKVLSASIGTLQGDNTLFAYNTLEKRTKIIASPLSIIQEANGSTETIVNPGDILTYTITYKNESAIGMRDVIIMQTVDPRFLDMSQLKLEQGAYDEASKRIIWRASDIPSLSKLEPGQGGTITYRVPVASSFKLESNEKNVGIRSLATIDSPDIRTSVESNKIVGSNLLIVRVGSLVALTVTPYFTGSDFENQGPLPPVVGSETSYTLKTKVTSSSNELREARVVFVLPSGVVYKEKSSPEEETVEFNKRSNEVVWEIGTLAPGKEKVLQLQVSITPNASQAGKDIELVRVATFTAKETFTNKTVTSVREGITNSLSDDSGVSEKSGTVQKKPE